MNGAIVAFVAITYGLSIAMSLLIGFTGGRASPFIGGGIATMLFPAVAVLAARRLEQGGPRTVWRRMPLSYVPVALLLIPVALHAPMLLVTASLEHGMPWQDWLSPRADGLYHTPAERGWGVLTGRALATRIAVNAVAGLIVVSTLAFFEELGWRAWLLPRLMGRMRVRSAIVITALLWALWHVPYALSEIQYIEGIAPPTTALVVPLGIVGSGLILGWLWVRTQSIWIVALAHGAHNNWGQYAFKYMRAFSPAHQVLALSAGDAALLIVGTLLVWSLGRSQHRASAVT